MMWERVRSKTEHKIEYLILYIIQSEKNIYAFNTTKRLKRLKMITNPDAQTQTLAIRRWVLTTHYNLTMKSVAIENYIHKLNPRFSDSFIEKYTDLTEAAKAPRVTLVDICYRNCLIDNLIEEIDRKVSEYQKAIHMINRFDLTLCTAYRKSVLLTNKYKKFDRRMTSSYQKRLADKRSTFKLFRQKYFKVCKNANIHKTYLGALAINPDQLI